MFTSDGQEKDDVDYEPHYYVHGGEHQGLKVGDVEDEKEEVHPLHSHILLYTSSIDTRSLLHFIKVIFFGQLPFQCLNLLPT